MNRDRASAILHRSLLCEQKAKYEVSAIIAELATRDTFNMNDVSTAMDPVHTIVFDAAQNQHEWLLRVCEDYKHETK